MNRASFLGLCYSDIFDYPLTKEELKKWGIKELRSKVEDYPRVGIKELRSKYRYQDGFYFLSGREKIIALRQKRAEISQKKLVLGEKIAGILQRIPFIKLIAVTGALAMKNSDDKDDIDLLIITQKNRVWLTRVLAVLILEILGKRRRPNDESFGNKICLNMFLDEDNFKIPSLERNLYAAHEVIQVRPIYNREQTYEKFLKQNSWVDGYLPRVRDKSIKYEKASIKQNNSFLDLVEVICYKLQYVYMKSKITRETVEKNRLLFHPRDTGKIVLEKFEKRV
ncbi:hypothetical protein HY030_03780 [Candidatus Gottesmanbacteria bacterium]|nr:hypothetical protein [Candidatus Gottesmanbacteria bacterium]